MGIQVELEAFGLLGAVYIHIGGFSPPAPGLLFPF